MNGSVLPIVGDAEPFWFGGVSTRGWMMLSEQPLTYSLHQAGELLGISRSLVYLMVKEGRLPTIRLRKVQRVTRQAIDELIGTSPGGNTHAPE